VFFLELSDLGYQSKGTKLRVDIFDWLFIAEETPKHFLNWLCSNVSSKNVLSIEEIEQYVFSDQTVTKQQHITIVFKFFVFLNIQFVSMLISL
jgi:hypothetical protein